MVGTNNYIKQRRREKRMGKERKNQISEVTEDVRAQYCNGDNCQYDCPSGKKDKCNAVHTGLF